MQKETPGYRVYLAIMTLMGCAIGILMAWKPDTYFSRFGGVVRADDLSNRGWGIVIAVGCFIGFLAMVRPIIFRRKQ